MTVYVDDVRHGFGRMIMCHMWADTEEELHAEAAALGLRRAWFQQPPKASWKHYDVSLGVKAAAMARGAVLTDKYGPVEYEHRRKLADKALPKEVHVRSRKMLKTIKQCREMFKKEK